NGAAAFGANLNLQTSQFSEKPFASWSAAAGSFNTLKNTVQFGSGLIDNSWYMSGRLSAISSDGYIDRSNSDLKSYYLESGYFGKKTQMKFFLFGGLEETYQSWWGTPEARLNDDVDGMNFVADMNWYSDIQRQNLLNSGRTFNYYQYENEVDHYQQDHYQLHVSHKFNSTTRLNAALHYTYGRGYYEQFRENDDLAFYDIDPVDTPTGTIFTSNLIRRRWLDNHFYGTTFSFEKDIKSGNITWGGAFNRYSGDHFGEVIWSQYAPNISKDYKYYDNATSKADFNTYVKFNYSISDHIGVYADMQVRNIQYSAIGPDHDRINYVPVQINVDEQFLFFNPKAGISYFPEEGGRVYLSFARANREPVRSDFIDNAGGKKPLSEQLDNLEAGIEYPVGKHTFFVNLYHMNYRNQLVLTGALNDVGSPLRENVDKSYRAGVEFGGAIALNDQFSWNVNATFSRNKIKNYTEVLYDYGVAWDEYNIIENNYETVDLSFSPKVISSSVISYHPNEKVDFAFISKYVGSQYLDNTQNDLRSIDGYFLNNLRLQYSFYPKFMKSIKAGLLLNNIFNEMYEANGYTFGYSGGGIEIRENYYYPQAGRNFLLSLNLLL
ncbi:MAG: TonB-dependent receptor, partial [Cyclobacteriaceae bacterium]|nr:TonB-dependent receptor [Cyclobacteriaceae bacterium]